MTIFEAIQARHSVRAYEERAIDQVILHKLFDKIDEINNKSNLHIQLVANEPKAFQGRLAKYGKFSGVSNYFVMAGHKHASCAEAIGYYGEQLVLYAQTLGLNTCWVGLTYSKIPGTYELNEDEKIFCYIALGYGLTQGVAHKTKTPEQVGATNEHTPEWFANGVRAALLAPSAINQQKYRFKLKGSNGNGLPQIEAYSGFSLAGYTKIDLGIAKYHFEVGAGNQKFVWVG